MTETMNEKMETTVNRTYKARIFEMIYSEKGPLLEFIMQQIKLIIRIPNF